MKTSALTIALLLAAFIAPVVSDDKAAKKDEDAFQGEWVMTSLSAEGGDIDIEQFGPTSLVVKGDEYHAKLGDRDVKSRFKLAADKTPKEVDFTYLSGEQEGKTVKGIYRLTNDTLTVCRGLDSDVDRPTEFKTDVDSKRIMVVWKRKPKEDKK